MSHQQQPPQPEAWSWHPPQEQAEPVQLPSDPQPQRAADPQPQRAADPEAQPAPDQDRLPAFDDGTVPDPAPWLPTKALVIIAAIAVLVLVITIVVCLAIWITPPMQPMQVPTVPAA